MPISPDTLSMLLLAAGLAAVSWLVMHRHPRTGVAAWLLTVCFVPVWVGVSAGFFFAPAVAVGLLLLTAALPATSWRPSLPDLMVAVLTVLVLLPVAVGGGSQSAVFAFLTELLLGYLLGRVVAARAGVEWTMSCVTVVAAVVAAFAVLEFVLGFNPFTLLRTGNSLYATWAPLQERGGLLRAEGAFGHSIALGCFLAIAVPFTLTRRWHGAVRLGVLGLLLVAVVLTFSRAGLICALLGLALTVLFLRRQTSWQVRVSVSLLLLLAAALVAPRIAEVFDDAGSEAAGSANYRGRLLSLIPDMSAFGVSPASYVRPDGIRMLGAFKSIDNALILFGLNYGYVALALALCGLGIATLWVVTGRGNPASVALVAQIPALVTVALITQYGILLAFTVGLAVAAQQPDGPAGPRDESDDSVLSGQTKRRL